MNLSMKRVNPLLLFLLLLPTSALWAQGFQCPEELWPAKKPQGNLWGYVNFSEEWVIEPYFERAEPFSGQLAIVYKQGGWGVIDCGGNVKVSYKYDEIQSFAGGAAWARKGAKWGLIGGKGNELLPPEYDEVEAVGPYSPATWVRKGEVWGLFHKQTGKWLLTMGYTTKKVLGPATSIAGKDGLFGLVENETGAFLLPMTMVSVAKPAPKVISFQVKEGGPFGLASDGGKLISAPQFEEVSFLGGRVLRVKKAGKYGLLTLDGTELVPAKYGLLEPDAGFLRAELEGKMGFINPNGEPYVPFRYDTLYPSAFGRSVARVEDNSWCLVQLSSGLCLGEKYSDMFYAEGAPYFVAGGYNDRNLLNVDGDEVLSGQHAIEIGDPYTHIRVMDLKQGWGYFNVKTGKFAFEKRFLEAGGFAQSGYAVVEPLEGGGYGVIDKGGNTVVPFRFDSVRAFSFQDKPYFETWKAGRSGMYDAGGKEVLPAAHVWIAPDGDHFLFKRESNEHGFTQYGFTTPTGAQVGGLYTFLANPLETDHADHGWPRVSYNGKMWGVIDAKGREVVPFKYQAAKSLGGGYYAVKKGKSWVLMNGKGSDLGLKSDDFGGVGEGFIVFQDDGKWGFMNTKGEVKFKPEYDFAHPFEDYMAPVKKGDKWGVLDRSGKIVVPFGYSDYRQVGEARLLLKDGNWYQLQRDGVTAVVVPF